MWYAAPIDLSAKAEQRLSPNRAEGGLGVPAGLPIEGWMLSECREGPMSTL